MLRLNRAIKGSLLIFIGVLILSTPIFSNVYFDELFYEHGSVMMVINADTGNIIEVNNAAVFFYGYSRDVLTQMNIDQINVLSPKLIMEEMENARNQNRNFFEFIHKIADGTVRTVEVYSYPYTLETGDVYLYSIIHDISDKVAAQKKARFALNWLLSVIGIFFMFILAVLHKSNASRKAIEYKSRELKSLFDNITEGFISVDSNGRIKTINPMGLSVLKIKGHIPVGKFVDEVYKRYDEEKQVSIPISLNQYQKNQVILLENSLGELVPVEETIVPIMPFNEKARGYVIAFKDITEQRHKQKHIEYLSYHDQLTGLYNRRFLEEEQLRLDVVRNYPLSVMMLDVNGLKLVNDAFGHAKGDALLKTLASVLKRVFRADDIIARTGGDEFIVLLPKTNGKDALCLKKRLNDTLKKTYLDCIPLSAGIGIATKCSENEDIVALIKIAENSMYQEKLTGSFQMKHSTIEGILTAIKKKSKREQIHNECVSLWAKKLSIELGLSDRQVEMMEIAGYLHDIGKIAIKDEVFEKKSPLTESEWQEIQKHAEIGYHILKSVDEYVELSEWVLCHHEWYDGSGYPRGIKSDKIPIQARILSVSDAYSAMTHARSYRNAMSNKEAIKELISNSGSQFDPKVVESMVQILNRERTSS